MRKFRFIKGGYKVLRSVLFTIIVVIASLFAATYIALYIPAVQNAIKTIAEKELTETLGGKLEIESVSFSPFNELQLRNVTLHTPQGERCITVERLGAGISLWRLISAGKIEIVYAEIIGIHADIIQPAPNSPLNIDFIINALAPKDKNKPPTRFDLRLRNVVIRKSYLSYSKAWMPASTPGHFDPNHIVLSDFKGDLELPVLKNDNFEVDLRRLAFHDKSGLDVESLSLYAKITPKCISIENFKLELPNSKIVIGDINLIINGFNDIRRAITEDQQSLQLRAAPLYLPDLAAFYNPLASVAAPFNLKLAASGQLDNISIRTLSVSVPDNQFLLSLSGDLFNINNPDKLGVDLDNLTLNSSAYFTELLCGLIPNFTTKGKDIVAGLGDFGIRLHGNLNMNTGMADADLHLTSSAGDITLKGDGNWNKSGALSSRFTLKTDNFAIGTFLANEHMGSLAADVQGDVLLNIHHPIDAIGSITAEVPYVDYNGARIDHISFTAEKEGSQGKALIAVTDEAIDALLNTQINFDGSNSTMDGSLLLNSFRPSMLGLGNISENPDIRGNLQLSLQGDNVDNLIGNVTLSDLNYSLAKKQYSFNRLEVTAERAEERRIYSIDSEVLEGEISGEFTPSKLAANMRNMLARTLPDLIRPASIGADEEEYANFSLKIPNNSSLLSMVKLPANPAVPITIAGAYTSGVNETFDMRIDAPYLVKGRDKLITNSAATISLKRDAPSRVNVETIFPVKYDRLHLSADIVAINDSIALALNWKGVNTPSNVGLLSMDALYYKDLFNGSPTLKAHINNSDFTLNDATWHINDANISYSGKEIKVNGLRVWHDLQYLDISGTVSDNPFDMITVNLVGIDLKYIFDTLNINYVNFGGIATGTVYASQLLTKNPVAATQNLFVRDLAYNNTIVGDGNLESHWDNTQKMVAINADIKDNSVEDGNTQVRGGVYVARDSLDFNFTTKKVDVRLLAPFMSGFTSSVTGRATGDVHLYGTFSDVDLTGWAFADTITMKVDHTNVYYSTSDSIFFYPGRISIPELRLYDKYGNYGYMMGELTHRYLHDPKFKFELTNARNLLVYDTNHTSDNRWYGRIFADGRASIFGSPGWVGIDINVRTAPKSTFTFELDEKQTAADYSFLSFSDRRKEKMLEETASLNFEDEFYAQMKKHLEERPDLFTLNIAVDVTPSATMTVVMDPDAGDKMVVHGQGAMQIQYSSDDDKLNMYGNYTVDTGTYNFSLQELILRDFKINPGSSISFNGDPLRGVLDIAAAYRVNTNLTDLDESFQSDPDLNRTSVPVDALLKVQGSIQRPDIKFDISLPTVTSEVERKVRSIISTDDMMNRQVIYLLALNRFYTPDYSRGRQGGEWASVASSTLSSQISNIIGSLTDKFSLSPTFKSEKDDLSDMEVDVALSSSLFNNRLIINGNLGYRDKSTSNTNFIGDFDIEYLLSKDGRLRLKAYNHFNDASYYLKSALTTQGIGLIYRKDFDNAFKFLKKSKKSKDTKRSKKGEKDKKSDITSPAESYGRKRQHSNGTD